jgi:putative ABC transport system substrate-binding protein
MSAIVELRLELAQYRRELGNSMRRREFITLFGSAVASVPVAARAQQPSMPVIGFLRTTSTAEATELVTAFRQGLKEVGFIEGQNVAIEFRWAEGHNERLPALVADLIHRQVAVIVGDAFPMLTVKAATTSIPIVFAAGGDPVGQGLVTSLNRPGGNVTGVHFFTGVLGAKRLELLRQILPKATTIAMLVHPNTPNTEAERRDVQAAAQTLGQPLIVLDADSDRDIDTVFATFIQRGAGALLVGSGPFMVAQRKQLIALTARHALPACYHVREVAMDGGLMSYGASVADGYRQVGIYAGRILKGEKPGDLPVMRSTKFEFVINLKTARTLGLEIPPALLATADEVIE